MKILGLIPARGGSKRLPGKNIRPLLGLPLIVWSGNFAASCNIFEHIVLSTDDTKIASVGRAHGIHVPELRPTYLSTDEATSVDVAIHVLNQIEAKHGHFDALALLQPTSPFRRAEPWHEAYIRLVNGAYAAIGVAPTSQSPHHSFILRNGDITPLFPDELSQPSQHLPETVYVTGGLYLIKTAILRETKTFFPNGTVPIFCSHPLDKVDIDTESDFHEAEWLADRYGVTPSFAI